ncbi:hypothetical protein RND81_06G229900 [Saponaria officinalis]|uniref:SHSP domain-containing protein n=1 Tax=Saponaria officinalis TaxID=3572 RepID=A0AAW1KE93_SAPOF
METPKMETLPPRNRRVRIIPRFRLEHGEFSESARPPTKFVTQASLLESMLVKRIDEGTYKKSGPGQPVSVWEVEGEGFVRVRIDMPGSNTVVVYPDPNENSINFKGVEEKISMHGIYKRNHCRTYEGSVFLDYERFPDVDFSYEFGHGVLRLKIRCQKPATSEDLGVLLTTNNQTPKQSANNPLLSRGKDRFALSGFNEDDNSFILAVDMPGLSHSDHVVIHVSPTGSISFITEEKYPYSYGRGLNEVKRAYEGHFEVDTEEFNCKKVEYEIVHGVFWVRVPRAVDDTMISAASDDGDHSFTIFPGEYKPPV